MIKEIIKAVATKLSLVSKLPGQGVFGSEKADEMKFAVSMYEPEISKIESKHEADVAAETLVDEYVDCIETQLTMALERTCTKDGKFTPAEAGALYKKLRGKSDIVVSESLSDFMSNAPKFKPAGRRKGDGRIRQLGTIENAKVYVNPYVKCGDIYVIDRSVIDVKYTIKQCESSIKIEVKSKTGLAGVSKYVLSA